MFEYLDYLTAVRKKHGEAAARLDLDYALGLRELTIKARIEAAEQTNGE